MNVPDFNFHAPRELDELFGLLKQFGPDARMMAGGTDLVVGLKLGRAKPREIISLTRIAGLDGVHFDGQAGLTILANATLSTVAKSAPVQSFYPMLASAISTLATEQVRNKGTVVGNLCNASPCADTAPPLMAYGATLQIISPDGEREVPVEQFITGVKQTQIQPCEVVRSVVVPPPPEGLREIFIKYSPRSQVDISAVSVATAMLMNGDGVKELSIFLGTVAPTPMRAQAAEQVLRGQRATEDLIGAAAAAARDECRPNTDHRASKEYKRQIVYVLTKRALTALVRQP